MNLFQLIFKDYFRYRFYDKNPIRIIFFTQGFFASCVYRLSCYIYSYVHLPILRPVCRAISFVLLKIVEVTTGISLPSQCQIGEGLYIGHFSGIILNSKSILGAHCNLSHGITIGSKSGGQHEGVPCIGNRVFIGPNAILIGNIKIGNDVTVGAGAVVTHSLPDRAVVVGNPAHVISYKGSFDYVKYEGMNDDLERQASLLLAEK